MHPGVALGLGKIKQIKFLVSLIYIFFQCLGAVFAAAFVYLTLTDKQFADLKMNQPTYNVSSQTDQFKMFLYEFLITFFLGFGLCALLTDQRATPEVYG